MTGKKARFLLVAFIFMALSSKALAWHEIVATEFGSADVLQWQERQELPEPGMGEVRLRVLTASASFTDVMIRKGLYAGIEDRLPFVPGYDLVGVVDEVGEGVTQFSVGQRVADLTIWGAYSEYVIRPVTYLVPVPEGVDPVEAVSLILSYTTAYQMLHRVAQVESGQSILVHGASGAVGSALTQLAVMKGIEVYGTASQAKQQYVRDLGATAIDYRAQDFVDIIDRATEGGGVDAAFDAISLENFKRSYTVLNDSGRLVTYGLFTATRDARPGESFSLAREFIAFQWQKLMWSWFGDADKQVSFYSIADLRSDHPDWFRQDLGELFELLQQGKLKPAVWRVMPLDRAANAHRLIEEGQVRGKIVLCVAAPCEPPQD